MKAATPLRSVQAILRTAARDAGSTLGASTAVLLLVALANVFIARLLGPEGQGEVAAATLIPTIVAYIGEFGIPAATGYYVNVRRPERHLIIATARSLTRALAIGLTAVAAVLILLLPLPRDARPLAFVFCAFVSLNLFYRLHLVVLQADLRLRAFNRLRIAGAATYVGILALLALSGSASTLGVVGALLVGNVVWCAGSIYLARSQPRWAYDRNVATALVRYGVRAQVGNVSVVDGLKVDQLVLALFLSSSQLGLYVAAMTIILGNRVIGISTGMVCFPLACRQDDSTSSQTTNQVRALLVATLVLSTMVALIEVLLGGRLLAFLFGASFRSAGPALQVLAVGSIFLNMRQVCAEWLRGRGRPGTVAVSELLAVVCLVVLSVFLWDGSIVRVAWIVSVSAVVSFLWVGLQVSRSAWARGPRARRIETA